MEPHRKRPRPRTTHWPGVAGLVAAVAISGCLHGHGERDEWQKPAAVIDSLDIDAGSVVADLGAGDGYFTFLLAEATGPTGKVFAIDTDEAALADLVETASERGLGHIESVLAEAEDPGLDPSSVDLILVSNTYHHLESRTDYFGRLEPTLRPGGRIAIIELDTVPWYLAVFLRKHTTSPEIIHDEMEAAGYVRDADHHFLDHQSFQVFSVARPGESPSKRRAR